MGSPGDGNTPGGRRAADIFADALELPAEARAAFLDDACGGDARLRAEVVSLLDSLPAARRFFAAASPATATVLAGAITDDDIDPPGTSPDSLPDRTLGPWRLVEQVAVGGMGAVYRGERVDAAFRKQVAVKVLRPWLDSAEMNERFRRERQVLAGLEHPLIARLLDGGTTPDGRPYLVMEYVDGEPIDRHADEARLPVAARLRLFLSVCEAVQFLHRSLVIHRDLKPSNILVDREGQVKLLDFGIAKALGGDAAAGAGDGDRTLTIALTPRYASPEQVRGEWMTTATDIYSLGVLLHELLAGGPPYEVPRQFTPDAARAICEGEPAPPSRVAARSDAATAARRGLTPARLAQALRGDLDEIVRKALQKEPARRYASVDELAADIRRHLDGLPVLAAPDRLGYRAGKFLRRHRVLTLASMSIATALTAALLVSVDAWRHARRQTREAEQLAYVNSLAAAESALRENMVDEAAARLALAPADLRGWEWRHLAARLDRSRLAVRAHANSITGVRVATDGAAMFTASLDSTVREWSLADGRPLRAWGPLGDGVESVSPAPDGTWLAAGLSDGSVLVLDRQGPAAPARLGAPSPWAVVAVRPDGLGIASAHLDGHVRLWDRRGGGPSATWRAHDGFAQVAWLPDGRRLVTGGGDGAVRVWDAATGRLLHDLQRHKRRVYCLAVSPDGRLVVSGGMDQLAVVHDLYTGEQLTAFHAHTGTVSGLAFTADGGQVLSCGPDGRLLRWDARTGVVLAELRGHRADAVAVAATPDGRQLVSADWGGTCRVWDAGAGDVVTLRVPSAPTMVVRSGRFVYDPVGGVISAGCSVSQVNMWSLRDPAVPPLQAACGRLATALSRTADGRFLLLGLDSGVLAVMAAHSRVIGDTLAVHAGPIHGVALHPDGRRLATAGEDARLLVRELAPDGSLGRAPVAVDSVGGALLALEFAPGGAQLAGAAADSCVYLWDWPVAAPPRALRGHGAAVLDVCFDPAGRRLASTGGDGWVRVWSVPDGQPLAAREVGPHNCGTIAWSGDGERIAVAGIDGTVRLLAAESLRELVGLRGHIARVMALAFVADDSLLVSSSRDGTIRVWTAPPLPVPGGR